MVRAARELAKEGGTPSNKDNLSLAISVVQREIEDQKFRVAFHYQQFVHLTAEAKRLLAIQDGE